MPFQPVLTVADPADARVLFDLVNESLTTGDHDMETRQRLITILIALHAEMHATPETGEVTP